jgi:hypothetical protein
MSFTPWLMLAGTRRDLDSAPAPFNLCLARCTKTILRQEHIYARQCYVLSGVSSGVALN